MRTQGKKMTMLACGLAGLMGTATAVRAADQPSKNPIHTASDPNDDPSVSGKDIGEVPPTTPPTAGLSVSNKEIGEVPPTVPSTADDHHGDPGWIAVKLHRLNLTEIQAGQAEQANGQSAQVKSLASHIVRDHQVAERQLAVYAKKHNMNLKGTESPKRSVDDANSSDDSDDLKMEADLRALKAHKGGDMDQAFLTAMITGHDKAINLVRTTRAGTKDNDLAMLLDRLLPSLQSHRDHAATLNNAINGTSSR